MIPQDKQEEPKAQDVVQAHMKALEGLLSERRYLEYECRNLAALVVVLLKHTAPGINRDHAGLHHPNGYVDRVLTDCRRNNRLNAALGFERF